MLELPNDEALVLMSKMRSFDNYKTLEAIEKQKRSTLEDFILFTASELIMDTNCNFEINSVIKNFNQKIAKTAFFYFKIKFEFFE